MESLQKILVRQVMEIPRKLLRELLAKKLQGVDVPDNVVSEMVEYLLSGKHGPVNWDDGGPDRDIMISLTDQELSEISNKVQDLAGKLPSIAQQSVRRTAATLSRKFKASWPELA